MLKKFTAILLALIMCMSVMLTGCTEENANVNGNDNEQVSTDVGVDTETGTMENDNVIDGENNGDGTFSLLAWKKQLAEKNELSEYDVKSYSDFYLFANQNIMQVLRDTLSPGRNSDFPIKTIFSDLKMSSFTTRYFNNGTGSGDYITMAETAYFQDAFYFFDNDFEIDVTYLKPGIAENVREAFTKTTYRCFGWDKKDVCTFVNFDINMIDGDNILKLKEASIPDGYTASVICDEIMLLYSRNGDLLSVCILLDDTYIKVRCSNDEGRTAPISTVFDRFTSSDFLSYLLNKNTVLTAKSILTTAYENAKNELR